MKKCYMCKKEYPRTSDYFYRNSSRPDGLQSICKKCRSKENKARHAHEGVIEARKWTKEEEQYISKRLKELPNSLFIIEKAQVIGKELGRTTLSIQSRIYEKGLNKDEKREELKEKFTTKESLKSKYDIGNIVKVKKTKTTITDIPTITGRIVGIYDNFIVIDNRKIRESFMYADMITGSVSVEEVSV